MSTTTTNYGLIKPDTTDPILIGQLNDNADAIDAALKENADAIENKPDAADIPAPSTTAPAMDGTGSAGTSSQYARADHVHPSDTSKQNALSSAQLAAVNSGINSTKVAQIETNKNNILSLAIANGKKQIIPYFGTASQGDIICTQSGNAITVSGTKGEALLNINISTISYSDAGIRAGDTLIMTNDNTNVFIALYFFDGTNYSSAVIAQNETTNVIVPSNYTHILIRLVCAATITTINETIHPMLCQKVLYEASPAVTPYSMSNAELTAAIQALQAQLANQ